MRARRRPGNPTKADASRQAGKLRLPALSAAQHAAIDELLRGQTDAEAAETAGVTRQTVNVWRNHHAAFQAELDRRLKSGEELLSVGELAARLDVRKQTVYAWAKRDLIPVMRVGRTIRFNWKEVYEAMNILAVMATIL